jgi:hypothetical protein
MFKSAKVAALENQIAFLKEQLAISAKRIVDLEAKVIELCKPVFAQAAPAVQTSVTPAPRPAVQADKRSKPRAVNLIQARDRLEAATMQGIEVEPKEEEPREREKETA